MRHAIACRLTNDESSRDGFAAEIRILEELASEADAEVERVRRRHGFDD